ncbi:hypothetical protein NUW54_g8139 [Trametes sanguinea]|uniref:Uncharacterized protein n=1 Tax=Trametes sanguinea TaxID=158606 RepID=A0ACC1PHA1_9APHY|nr:hypothetical protein NUW54_g8139 [Trametes sanguinea]
MFSANANSTPLALHRISSQFASGPARIAKEFQSLAQYRLALVDDMAHKAVRMEVPDFADTFLPLPAGVLLEEHPAWATDIFGDLAEGGALLESEIADKFVNAVNNNNLIAGLQMAQSPNKPEIDDVDDFKQKIDAAFYREGDVPTDGRPHWADQLISVEFKRHEINKDPFEDRENRDLDATAEERKKVRAPHIPLHAVGHRP